jgi:hypothetical protein
MSTFCHQYNRELQLNDYSTVHVAIQKPGQFQGETGLIIAIAFEIGRFSCHSEVWLKGMVKEPGLHFSVTVT